jgi:serine protease Do
MKTKNNILLFVCVVIILYFVFFYGNENENFTEPSTVEKLNKSVVRINASVLNYNWTKPYISNSSTSVGTGFFINNSGYILTCYHVVDKSYKLEITIPGIGQNKYDAEIISVYPERDIALIKIKNYENTDFLKLGNSDFIKPTDKVNAVGYMLASDQLKITAGTISGYNNNIIQTDTVINSGNSGGPLLNSKFEVIGINVSKIVSYGVEGVNYAVPIKQYLINEKLFNDNKHKIIRAPKLGIVCNNINDDFSKYFVIKPDIGYIINKIAKNSPAEKAGLEIGDIILSFDGHVLDNYGMTKIPENIEKVHLDYLVYNKSPADKVDIQIISNKTKNIKNIGLDLSNNNFYEIKYLYPGLENPDYVVLAGLVLMNLSMNHVDTLSNANNELLKYKNIQYRDENKIIVTSIIPGSKINTLNVIYPGDIIKSINDIELNDLLDIKNILKNNIYDYIKIMTDQNKIYIISKKNAISEEKYLSEINKYNKFF